MPKHREKKKEGKRARFSFWQSGKMDLPFFIVLSILLVLGLIMLFSASYVYAYNKFGDSYKFIKQQLLFGTIGFGAMFLFSKIDYHIYKKLAWPLYFGIVALLGLILVLPPMISGVDFKRWVSIGPLSFQPSEIAKFSIVLLFAYLLEKYPKRLDRFWKGFVVYMLLLGLICGLVVLEPHLSATILIAAIGILLVIIGGAKFKHILIAAFGVAALGVGAILTKVVDYGGDRIKYWLNPWDDALGKGFQTIQSLLAIGSGGFFGRGLGQSRQKYLWVPEPHNDFIFSIVCEELGFFGAMIIITLFCYLVYRGFTIASRANDKFGAYLAVGLTFQVGLQALLNILVVTNTIPNTGISLPFFSYGGTAIVILLSEMGIVLSVSRSARMPKE